MIEENGIKNIRMGWKNSFIKGVILSDDSIIQNMQCSKNAILPTNEELEKIDKLNRKSKEKETLTQLETMNCEVEEVLGMVDLMIDECFAFNDTKYDVFELRDKFRTAQKLAFAISKLLRYQIKESNDFVDEVYAERKVMNMDKI